jgi:RNA polymerase subunit RPABC4/transcription elongation factor Spt4
MNATCVQCSKAIRSDSKFCPYCGKERPTERAEKKCVECSQALVADAVFCPDCGKDQRAAQQAEVQRVLQQESGCAFCDGVVAADAKFCPHCGNDQSTFPPAIRPVSNPKISAGHSSTFDLSCRKCRSDNVKKLPIAYAEGLSMVNLNSSGAGIGIGSGGIGLGVGASDTRGTSQTLWSSNMAPPELNHNTEVFGVIAIVLVLIAVCLFITTSFLGGAVIGAGAVFFWRLSNQTYKENYERKQEIAKWEASYVCLRCGEIFVDEKECAQNRETARLLALLESGDEIYQNAPQD